MNRITGAAIASFFINFIPMKAARTVAGIAGLFFILIGAYLVCTKQVPEGDTYGRTGYRFRGRMPGSVLMVIGVMFCLVWNSKGRTPDDSN